MNWHYPFLRNNIKIQNKISKIYHSFTISMKIKLKLFAFFANTLIKCNSIQCIYRMWWYSSSGNHRWWVDLLNSPRRKRKRCDLIGLELQKKEQKKIEKILCNRLWTTMLLLSHYPPRSSDLYTYGGDDRIVHSSSLFFYYYYLWCFNSCLAITATQ